MMRVAAVGSIRSRLGGHGLVLPPGGAPGQLRQLIKSQLAALGKSEARAFEADLKPLIDLCDSLGTYLRKLDAGLAKTARSHPVCSLLMEVPGVGRSARYRSTRRSTIRRASGLQAMSAPISACRRDATSPA